MQNVARVDQETSRVGVAALPSLFNDNVDIWGAEEFGMVESGLGHLAPISP